jgi:hypothetical protein
VEKIYLNEYFKISTLIDDVKDYMEFHNYRRFILVPAGLHHETLDYLVKQSGCEAITLFEKKPMNVYWNSIKINDENYSKLDENVA